MGVLSVLFFAGSFAAVSAAFARSDQEPPAASCYVQKNKPTFAIFVLLIAVFSWLMWLMILAMHVFDTFIKTGPGSVKYIVTLGIAISSAMFMQIYGNRVVREHFGRKGGHNLEVTSRQALCVVVFVVSFGIYVAWLMV